MVDPEPFRLAVNDRLPADIHVLSLTLASEGVSKVPNVYARSG